MDTVNLLVLEEKHLKSMLTDPRFLAAVPSLQATKNKLEQLNPKNPNCPKCIKKARVERTKAIRAGLLSLSQTRGAALEQLKQLLNARQLRIVVVNSAGQSVKVTL